MSTYLYIAQIVVAVALIMVAMLQVRGGGLGGIFLVLSIVSLRVGS